MKRRCVRRKVIKTFGKIKSFWKIISFFFKQKYVILSKIVKFIKNTPTNSWDIWFKFYLQHVSTLLLRNLHHEFLQKTIFVILLIFTGNLGDKFLANYLIRFNDSMNYLIIASFLIIPGRKKHIFWRLTKSKLKWTF